MRLGNGDGAMGNGRNGPLYHGQRLAWRSGSFSVGWGSVVICNIAVCCSIDIGCPVAVGCIVAAAVPLSEVGVVLLVFPLLTCHSARPWHPGLYVTDLSEASSPGAAALAGAVTVIVVVVALSNYLNLAVTVVVVVDCTALVVEKVDV